MTVRVLQGPLQIICLAVLIQFFSVKLDFNSYDIEKMILLG